MSGHLKIAARLYTWLAIVFLAGYILYISYDDYVFIEQIDSFSALGVFLLYEFIYLTVYFLAFTFFYIAVALVVIGGTIAIQKFGPKN